MARGSVKVADLPYYGSDDDRLLDMEMSVDLVIDGKSSSEWIGDATPAEVVAYLRKVGFDKSIEVNLDIITSKGFSQTVEAYISHKDGRQVALWMEATCAFGRGLCIFDSVYGSTKRGAR